MVENPVDGVFLDFLYPQLALASFSKVIAQHSERRKRRVLKRAFVRPIYSRRGYSSRPYTPFAEDVPPTKERAREPKDRRDRGNILADLVGDTKRKRLDRTTAGQTPSPLGFANETQDGLPLADPDSSNILPASSLFSDSPAELAELPSNNSEDADLESFPEDPLRALRYLMARARPSNGSQIARAWSLYRALAESDKKDIRLVSELLSWMVKQNNDVAAAHAISLYLAVPVAERVLPIYQAALTAFMRRKDFDSAIGLHKEALGTIPNGFQITRQLFEHAVRNRLFDLASSIQEDHHHVANAESETKQQALLWLHVADMPDLLSVTARLVKDVLSRLAEPRSDMPPDMSAQKKEEVARDTNLTARMAEEALSQIARPGLSSGTEKPTPSRSDMNRLLYFVRYFSSHKNATISLQNYLVSTLQQIEQIQTANSADWHFQQNYSCLSYAYTLLRTIPGARPPVSLLWALLHRLLWHSESSEILQHRRKRLAHSIIIRDWESHHGNLSSQAVRELTRFYARRGDAERVEHWFSYMQQKYLYEDTKELLHLLVYVHSRRIDLVKAEKAFERIREFATANGDQLDVSCWNVLLHAKSRADDYFGAIETFRMLLDAEIKPDERTIQPLLEMASQRGDVQGVEKMLAQFDRLSDSKRNTVHVAAHMIALERSGQTEKAEQILLNTIRRVKIDHEIPGSLTGCFNVLLEAYVVKRDAEATRRVHEWMKAENIDLNAKSYGILMLGLVSFRQTNNAHRILRKILPQVGIRPTALHYSIVVHGYAQQGMFDEAIAVHDDMTRKAIKPTVSSRQAYLRAKAGLDLRKRRESEPEMRSTPTPLEEVISELEKAVLTSDGSELAPKQPLPGYLVHEHGTAASSYIAAVMEIHGRERCLEAVRQMFQLHKTSAANAGLSSDFTPMRILSALMLALCHSQEYDKVEMLWKMAKDEADSIAAPVTLPHFGAPSVDFGEVDDSDVFKSFQDEFEPPDVESKLEGQASIDAANGPRPDPGRKYILSDPAHHYFRALSAENRMEDMVQTCTQLLQQGYSFDIWTWNRFIEHLCTSSPRLVLLAFTLTERFLINNFPAWKGSSRFPPKKTERLQNLQYIRARYLPRGHIMPQYRTMLHLAAALLDLRRTEAVSGMADKPTGLYRFVGTVSQVQQMAPRTAHAVRSIPFVDDAWQNRLLRGGVRY